MPAHFPPFQLSKNIADMTFYLTFQSLLIYFYWMRRATSCYCKAQLHLKVKMENSPKGCWESANYEQLVCMSVSVRLCCPLFIEPTTKHKSISVMCVHQRWTNEFWLNMCFMVTPVTLAVFEKVVFCLKISRGWMTIMKQMKKTLCECTIKDVRELCQLLAASPPILNCTIIARTLIWGVIFYL